MCWNLVISCIANCSIWDVCYLALCHRLFLSWDGSDASCAASDKWTFFASNRWITKNVEGRITKRLLRVRFRNFRKVSHGQNHCFYRWVCPSWRNHKSKTYVFCDQAQQMTWISPSWPWLTRPGLKAFELWICEYSVYSCRHWYWMAAKWLHIFCLE